ncbi:MAG: PAS domain-containing protein, partial [Tangfeifania sp.]
MKQPKASTREIKSKEIQAQSAREFAESIIDTVRQPLIVLDADLRVVSANRYFYNTFLVLETQTVGKPFYKLGNNQWDIPKLKELLKKSLPEESTVNDFEVEHDFEKIGHKVMLLNARELEQKQEKERLILLAI